MALNKRQVTRVNARTGAVIGQVTAGNIVNILDWRGGTASVNLASVPVAFNVNRFTQRTLAACTAALSGRDREHCWVHVSLLSLINSEAMRGKTLTYPILLTALIQGEYGAYILNTGLNNWATEAISRQFHTDCGRDGCQGQEVYTFLDYFQPARDGKLDDGYQQFTNNMNDAQRPYFQNQARAVSAAASLVLNPTDASWRTGVARGQPYGFGTRGLGTSVNVSDTEVARFARLCGFASRTYSQGNNPPMGQMFIGTTPETDPATGARVGCHFSS